jgi:dyslexia susceptibility 1 candidate gene 1 protein
MLIIKDFKWFQSDDEIFIQLALKNASSQVDILTHENFIKIHAAPYYFEAFLLHPIIEEESRCQLTKHEARFFLKKLEKIEWEKLERDFQDKAEKSETKREIVEKVQEKAKEKLKLKQELKDQIKRSEVENSIAKDAEVRETIEKMQKLVIEKEMTKVEEIKKAAPRKPQTVEKIQQKAPVEVTAIRKSASIVIQFSKRNFITPKRESQDPAEQEWLLKQAEARKAIGFVVEDLLPEERDPMYLKEKGDEFFRQQNYLAAISAYSTGIKLANKCYELYLNRSAAHLAQENYQRCAEDCSKALELLNPPVASNLKARTQALARRGASLSKLGFIRQAYEEFVAAVKLDPTNEILRHDAEMLRAKLEANDDE